ncbi:MAG: pantoate--beta-alanine ligase [Bacteriovoracaceae bacterium]|nr:pantoate--beta-alanine ligase [Bacteriovoracaceae bacterium]
MIKVFTTKFDFNHYRNSLDAQKKNYKIGLVPTMGNLHKGHLSLIEKSAQDNDITVITIFVNPTQFGPTEDFDKYPRTLDDDLARISSIAITIDSNKEIVVFAPKSIEEIYPKGFSTTISIGAMKEKLEGAIRPTHFDGVTTVVYRLFSIAGAHNAYFGQKDFQQCLIIKKMVLDLELSVVIHIMPIIRNTEGLALSSRNQYLSDKERTLALTLPHTLNIIEKLIKTNQDYKSFIEELKKDERWNYICVLDAKSLEEPDTNTSELVIIGAFKLGNTRLLDNKLVTLKKEITHHDGQ